MTIDPIMAPAALGLAVIFATGLIVTILKQPYVVAYILAGIFIGPYGLDLVADVTTVERLGAVGVTLLLFFVGLETHPTRLVKGWRVSIFGTIVQIVISVGFSFVIGTIFNWPPSRSLLLGFVISLSSTAVVLSLMETNHETGSQFGQDTIGVLVIQDVAAIAMIITLGFMVGGTEGLSLQMIAGQISGGLILVLLIIWVALGKSIRLPFASSITKSPEMQVFGALTLCFGLGYLSSSLGLSAAIGAFAGGLVVGAAKATQWVSASLASFKTVFLALFFVSIGVLLDLAFIIERAVPIGALVLVVLLSSMLVNSLIYKLAGYDWRQSFYAGALLAQPGEFSFVLAAIGATTGIISGVGYQLSLAVIALSLAISPIHIQLVRKWLIKPVRAETNEKS